MYLSLVLTMNCCSVSAPNSLEKSNNVNDSFGVLDEVRNSVTVLSLSVWLCFSSTYYKLTSADADSLVEYAMLICAAEDLFLRCS